MQSIYCGNRSLYTAPAPELAQVEVRAHYLRAQVEVRETFISILCRLDTNAPPRPCPGTYPATLFTDRTPPLRIYFMKSKIKNAYLFPPQFISAPYRRKLSLKKLPIRPNFNGPSKVGVRAHKIYAQVGVRPYSRWISNSGRIKL
jgi:hypothetical protein